MKSITIYYNADAPGAPWDLAISKALAAYPEDERQRVQVVCLPENYKNSKRKEIAP